MIVVNGTTVLPYRVQILLDSITTLQCNYQMVKVYIVSLKKEVRTNELTSIQLLERIEIVKEKSLCL